ncbi:MAG TPA: 2Fe-2S iron-sulfur cluster-binding protein [Rhizomicrobium sp.]|nr:2Fe-2S iron-sulfur cluster-binding protein [Rhizomicrobium sp.]HEX4026516.1 2Fe-2S iron-sulfur cluster-binding protein [Rhizomicrobium sp.]
MAEAQTVTQQASGAPSPDAVPLGPRVAVTLWEAGQARAVEAHQGESLMVALKRAGLGLLAVCGGKGACGTCRVAFAPQWSQQLTEPDKRELRLLAHLKARPDERLSCRILLTAALAGLEVDACE